MKKTYPVLYCIEHDSERIGFAGLYNMRCGETAEMTLVIGAGKVRRLGHGGTAFALLARSLKKHGLVRHITVRVRTENTTAVSFWRKMGFSVAGTADGIEVMEHTLTGYGHFPEKR